MSMLLIADIGFEGGLYGNGIFYAEGTGHEVGLRPSNLLI